MELNEQRREDRVFDLDLDPLIADAVHLLLDNGVETFESCQGGAGHCSPYPFIHFYGPPAAGFQALSVAMTFGLPVLALKRVWTIIDGEPTGPQWEFEFLPDAFNG